MEELHPDFEKEREYLEYVLGYLNSYYEKMYSTKLRIDGELAESIKRYDPDNLEQYHELTLNTQIQASLEQKTKMAVKSLKKPYFARVDFRADDEKSVVPYYIGKMSLLRESDSKPLIIDWRAPVSTLYYEGRIGDAEYDCPDGIIKGDISLKRQYFIENARLSNFFDIDVTANDEFLQVALGSSKDKRLKDIVSTIQAEQNRIIRADMNKPVVVQGNAGSGKTTIALHRIAYLLYNYEKVIAPKNIMILAPSRYFLSYISEVLPDLGVENIIQTTVEDFACAYIGSKLKIKPAADKLAFLIKNPDYYNSVARISKIKTSLAFKRVIDNYVSRVTEKLIPEKHFMLGGFVLYDYKVIRRLICEDYSYLPVSKRANEVRKYLVNMLKQRKPVIADEICAGYDKKLSALKTEMPEDNEERRAAVVELLNKRDAELKQLQKQSDSIVKEYFALVTFKKAEQYYEEFISDEAMLIEAAERYLQHEDIRNLRKLSVQSLKSGAFEAEDLAPIMYIHNLIYGNDEFDIRHIVIDEAQDVGLFQLAVLKKIMNSNSFSILGDLYQGIYSYKGITDWSDVTGKVFNHYARFMTLERSYRTTVEIMDFANRVSSGLKMPPGTQQAVPVIRHGSEVCVKVLDSSKEIAENIDETIKKSVEAGYKSVAVICRTIEEAQSFKELLDCQDIRLIDGKDDDYGGGIVLVPAYLAKGLEFDCVIIADAGTETYSGSETDIKLLYIAMTRALHELTVFAKWELCDMLKENANSESIG